MNINLVQEPESNLKNRKGLYLDPDSELSQIFENIQDAIENEGILIDRSRYKTIDNKLCKFYIELISNFDSGLLLRRSVIIKKLTINLDKLKWEFNVTSKSFILKIGKIIDKELSINIVSVVKDLGATQRDTIKKVKDKIIREYKNIKNNQNNDINIQNLSINSPPKTSFVSFDDSDEEEETKNETKDESEEEESEEELIIDTPPIPQYEEQLLPAYIPINSKNNNQNNYNQSNQNNKNKNMMNKMKQSYTYNQRYNTYPQNNNIQNNNLQNTPRVQPQYTNINQLNVPVIPTKMFGGFKVRGKG